MGALFTDINILDISFLALFHFLSTRRRVKK
jgi:hypothetical protein